MADWTSFTPRVERTSVPKISVEPVKITTLYRCIGRLLGPPNDTVISFFFGGMGWGEGGVNRQVGRIRVIPEKIH